MRATVELPAFVVTKIGIAFCRISSLFRLRRIYILINAPHGLTAFDEAMLENMQRSLGSKLGTSITLQAILTKIDELPPKDAKSKLADIEKSLFEIAPYCLPPILTAINQSSKVRIGVEAVQQSIADACMVPTTP